MAYSLHNDCMTCFFFVGNLSFVALCHKPLLQILLSVTKYVFQVNVPAELLPHVIELAKMLKVKGLIELPVSILLWFKCIILKLLSCHLLARYEIFNIYVICNEIFNIHVICEEIFDIHVICNEFFNIHVICKFSTVNFVYISTVAIFILIVITLI